MDNETDFIYVNSKGVTITLSLDVDLSTVTAAKILYKKPSGDADEWTATVDTENSAIFYKTSLVENEIDEAGVWELQPYCESLNWKIYGKIVTILVRNIIEEE